MTRVMTEMGKVKTQLVPDVVSEFFSDDGIKTAAVLYAPAKGFSVMFKKKGNPLGIIDYPGKAERYAEDAAENWVMGIFKEDALNRYLEETSGALR